MKLLFLLLCFLFVTNSFSQYHFKGQVDKSIEGKTVYLSMIEDYRKLSRISYDQIIKKAKIDSLGHFSFKGTNLPNSNRIYRIHIDECNASTNNADHFFGKCINSKSVLFIANNNDTILFPTGFENQALCEISSTNQKSSVFLEIDVLKEAMAFDFNDFNSEANKKLNSKNWFSTLQDFGKNLKEPLAELYIFDFLSDKRNETYAYYLKDLAKNNYYANLLERLKLKYPDEEFTKLYQTEIASDKSIISSNNTNWKWILSSLLTVSILFNLFFIWQRKTSIKKEKRNLLKKLTTQEQKIVDEILKDKTNKEIATVLFISLSTVKTHINNLYKKLNVATREEIKQLLD